MKFSPKVSNFHKSCPGDICKKSHIFQVKLTSTAFVKSTLSSLLSEVRTNHTNHTYWLVFTHLPFTVYLFYKTKRAIKDNFPGWRFSWPLVGDRGGPGNAAACQILPAMVFKNVPLLLNWLGIFEPSDFWLTLFSTKLWHFSQYLGPRFWVLFPVEMHIRSDKHIKGRLGVFSVSLSVSYTFYTLHIYCRRFDNRSIWFLVKNNYQL